MVPWWWYGLSLTSISFGLGFKPFYIEMIIIQPGRLCWWFQVMPMIVWISCLLLKAAANQCIGLWCCIWTFSTSIMNSFIKSFPKPVVSCINNVVWNIINSVAMDRYISGCAKFNQIKFNLVQGTFYTYGHFPKDLIRDTPKISKDDRSYN